MTATILFMASWLLGAFICGATVFASSNTTPAIDRGLIQAFQSGDWVKRSGALRAIAGNQQALGNSEIQRALSQLLERESLDPGWSGKSEFVAYSQYYALLIETLQTVATKFHSPAAWRALTSSNYDDSSKFAGWIASQPEAIEYLFSLTKDGHEIIRARASFVLARALERCEGSVQDGSCDIVLKQSDNILTLLRRNARDSPSTVEQLSAVRGLGICGRLEDIRLLSELAKTDKGKWFGLFVQKSETKIENRWRQKKPDAELSPLPK